MKKINRLFKVKRVNRSLGGNIGVFFILALLGLFFVFPLIYICVNAFKPINELFIYPPRFNSYLDSETTFTDTVRRLLSDAKSEYMTKTNAGENLDTVKSAIVEEYFEKLQAELQ